MLLVSLQIFRLPADVHCLPVSLVSYLPVLLSHCYIPSFAPVSQGLVLQTISGKPASSLMLTLMGFFDPEPNSHRNVGQWDDGKPALRVQHKCAHAENRVSCILFCSLVSIFQLSVLFHCLHPSHVQSGDVKAQNSAA